MIDSQSFSKQLGRDTYEKLFELLSSLRRREIRGSYQVARHTAEFYRVLIASAHWKTAEKAISMIHELGNILTAAQPIELCLGNITRRILFFIRDANAQMKKKRQNVTPLDDFLSNSYSSKEPENIIPFKSLKPLVIEEIGNLLEELDVIYQNISNQALDHIHANEIIMTIGRSNTVVNFFKTAGRKRSFHVVIAESAPSYRGKQTAKELADAGIDSTLISDAGIFCMMSRVNKVIVGTNAVLANGGLLTNSGVRMLAEAANYYSVPFVVISGMYKLSPVYPSDNDMFSLMNSPGEIISFKELDVIGKDNPEGVDVLNPAIDYIPPELVSLYLTNYGVHYPSYIYRMLSEYYNLADYTFSSKYDEELIQVRDILALPDEEVVEALDCFLALKGESFDFNRTIEDNKTLLEIACERNYLDIIVTLLSKPIAVDKALEIACEQKNGKIVQLLQESGQWNEDNISEAQKNFINSLE